MAGSPNGVGGAATNPVCAVPPPGGAAKLDSKTKELIDSIEEKAVAELGPEVAKKVELTPVAEGELRLRVSAQDFYKLGSSDLSPQYRAFMNRVAAVIAQAERDVRIVGHADPQEVRAKAAFTSTWDLSQARAARLAQQWIERGGIAPVRVSVAGRAHYEPLDPEKYPWVQKSGNRRVEIWIR